MILADAVVMDPAHGYKPGFLHIGSGIVLTVAAAAVIVAVIIWVMRHKE